MAPFRAVVSAPGDGGASCAGLQAPYNAYVVLRKCEAGNPRQWWRHGGEPAAAAGLGSARIAGAATETAAAAAAADNGTVPGRLWTVDEDGKRWCMGEGSWARPMEVLPCDEIGYRPAVDEGASCSCNFTSPCCHKTQNFTYALGPICEAGVTEPRYCSRPTADGGATTTTAATGALATQPRSQ